MKSINVHIKKLGLITDSDITISPLMVFSGESGLGKSYTAILCHYFFSVWLSPLRLNVFFKDKGINFSDKTTNIPDSGIAYTLNLHDFEEWLAQDAVKYLQYMLGVDSMNADISVSLPLDKTKIIDFSLERELMGLNNAEDFYFNLSVLGLTYRFRELGIQDESPYSYVFRFAMIQELFGNFNDLSSSFVLPPSRGTYLSEDVRGTTGLYKSFIAGMKELDEVQEIPDTVSSELKSLFEYLLEGEVKKVGDKYIYYTHGDSIPSSAAASSVREIAPLQIMAHKKDISKLALLIEEPEAHLHPLKQLLMADAMALMSSGKANIQITTHSDYFLRRLNDLMRLHILKNNSTSEEFDSFCETNKIDGSITLNPKSVKAYFLQKENDSVRIIEQNSLKGIPFDTFAKINGKPMADSSLLYESTIDIE